MQYRHIHIYAAGEAELLPNAEEYIKPFKPLARSSAEENAKRELLHNEAERERLLKCMHTSRLSEIQAVVFDFYSEDSKTDYAAPVGDASKSYIVSDTKRCGKAVEFGFLESVSEYVADGPELHATRVAFRCKDGSQLRHAIRVGAMKTGKLFKSQIPGALYFANPTFSWKSVLAPDAYCDQAALMSQLPFNITKKRDIEVELQTTLQVYALAGLVELYNF